MQAESLVATYGIWAVLVGTFLEGETVLVLAGFACHRGYLDLGTVVLAGIAGSFAGDELYFFLGRWRGKAFLDRRAKAAVLATVQRRLERHRTLLIVGSRFLYGFRIVIPAFVGASGVPASRFTPLNLVGAVLWSVLVTSGGYAFGATLALFVEDVAHYELAAIVAIGAVGAAVWAVVSVRARRHRASAPPRDPSG